MQNKMIKAFDELESNILSEIEKLRETLTDGFVVKPETDDIYLPKNSRSKYPFGQMEVMTTWVLPDSFDRNKAIEACRKQRQRYGKRFRVDGRKFTRVE